MPTNPAEKVRIHRQRAAHARELARNITDQQAINALNTFADDLERQAAEFEAQAAAVVEAVKVTETTAQSTEAVPALKPAGKDNDSDAAPEVTKPSSDDGEKQ